MSISSHPLERLPQGALQDLFSYLSPNDLANVRLLKKREKVEYIDNVITVNKVWNEIAKKIDCPIMKEANEVLNSGDIRNQVKKCVLDIKQEIKSLNETLPKDIAEIVNGKKAPTFEEIQLLKDYRKARDILVVWGRIVNTTQQSALIPSFVWNVIANSRQSSFKPGNFKTSIEMFAHVNQFTDWCNVNQNSLNQLLELDLRNLNLITLPSQIGSLTQLDRLDLRNNKLTMIPPEIGQCTQLYLLWINNNKLTFLPNEIGQLTQLYELSLENNELTSLPKNFVNLTQLNHLNLSNNEFIIVPPEIENLPQLVLLELSHNKLTELPKELFENLPQLRVLNLSNNELIILPPEITKLTQLNWLDLSYNHLEEIEPLTQLTQLTTLMLDHNKLTALPKAIRKLPQLQQLSTGSNPIPFSDRFFPLRKDGKEVTRVCGQILVIGVTIVLYSWLGIFSQENC